MWYDNINKVKGYALNGNGSLVAFPRVGEGGCHLKLMLKGFPFVALEAVPLLAWLFSSACCFCDELDSIVSFVCEVKDGLDGCLLSTSILRCNVF
jgi:hypothetical protein